jgi:hypothetical protein
MRPTIFILRAAHASALCLALLACSAKTPQNTPTTQTAESPLPAEHNPPGDIADTQRFVEYSVPGAYAVLVPEGWARNVRANTATFTDKFDGEQITIGSVSNSAASLASARSMRDLKMHDAALPGGRATETTFTSNSDTDPVTGKRVRLQNEAYVFYPRKACRPSRSPCNVATLHLWAPLGTDNVDQLNRIARSFKWL